MVFWPLTKTSGPNMPEIYPVSHFPSLERLAPKEVHVWAFNLSAPPDLFARLESRLAGKERERAARFRFDLHRERFIVGRGLLRELLGNYLDRDAEEIEFAYGAHGKPCLTGQQSPINLHFNLAHSESRAVVAITTAGAVGIDIEQIRNLSDADELVARFFSPRESRAFRSLPPEQRPLASFNLWTRKEAWLKATGDGIGQYLNQVEVSFLPGEPARLLTLPISFASGGRWSLSELAPPSGFVAALATTMDEPLVKCWDLEADKVFNDSAYE